MASTYLTRAQASGNRRTVTFSAWVKRSALGDKNIFNGTDNSSEFTALYFTSADELFLYDWRGSEGMNIKTTQKFRDTSAWYHIVVAFDTTQATASNRVKIYVNGSQVTDFATSNYPAQNLDLMLNVNSSFTTKIGVYPTSNTLYFDGYMAHVHFTEGTQYAASDFGETDTNGQWSPKPSPSVTYGTNGFFLKFANSGSLGTDSSGNGNNFTVSGSGDQVTDTPDNVFATLNPLQRSSTSAVLSEGNCKLTNNTTSNPWQSSYSTIGMNTGKWYWEYKVDSQNGSIDPAYGIVADSNTQYQDNTFGNLLGQQDATASSYGISFYGGDGTVYWSHIGGFSNSSAFGGHSVGDIIGVAVDFDNDAIYFSVNGTYVNSGDPTSGASKTGAVTTGFANNQTWFAQGQCYTSSDSISANFGNPAFSITSGNTDDNGYGNFEYAPPTGYLALCTKNLAETLTLPINNGKDYFNPVLWTGNNGTQSVTGVGFQPDIFWTKIRSQADAHRLADSIRGGSNTIRPNTDGAAYGVNAITFDSDGFTTSGNEGFEFNYTGESYVSWSWLVNGGTTSSNSDGSITSTVQVNTTSGVSIVQYTGTGSNATVGHGLGKVPDIVIAKVTSAAANDWGVQMNNALGFYNALRLNQTNAYGGVNGAGWWNDTAPTTTTVSLGNRTEVNASGQTYIMYCFNNVEGYSKMGTYTGNGNADGTFIYTGFRPAFTIIKKTSDVGVWFMYDTTRDIDNKVQHRLLVNDSQAENTGSGDDIDIVSNGIKVRSSASAINASGQTFMYMAFAENPFVDSTGRPVTAR